ncbi:MAG: hypothetical protein EA419_04450 [Wenzhouxiangella sp.]|nr:MAG: hypothetical protein EA419_04450 [Wenzhouxiangella sp.]
MNRRRNLLNIACCLLALISSQAVAERFIVVASTTSIENSGLFAHLLPPFEERSGIQVRVVSVGTGAALQFGRRCDADVVMVHAPDLEQDFVASGFGLERHPLMHNDFILVGPDHDPAGIRGLSRAAEAFARIANTQSRFVSRADRSGTHAKEMELWRIADFDPTASSGQWYLETGSGMGQALNTARAMDAYVLADRASWLGFGNRGQLQVLAQGDPILFNPYGVILVNEQHCPNTRSAAGQQFIDWLVSEAGQQQIASFTIDGSPLFVPAHTD